MFSFSFPLEILRREVSWAEVLWRGCSERRTKQKITREKNVEGHRDWNTLPKHISMLVFERAGRPGTAAFSLHNATLSSGYPHVVLWFLGHETVIGTNLQPSPCMSPPPTYCSERTDLKERTAKAMTTHTGAISQFSCGIVFVSLEIAFVLAIRTQSGGCRKKTCFCWKLCFQWRNVFFYLLTILMPKLSFFTRQNTLLYRVLLVSTWVRNGRPQTPGVCLLSWTVWYLISGTPSCNYWKPATMKCDKIKCVCVL